MKMNNFRDELTDNSAKKEALVHKASEDNISKLNMSIEYRRP